MLLPFRVIMMGPMDGPAHHDGTVLALAEEGEGVEPGLGLPFRKVAAVQVQLAMPSMPTWAATASSRRPKTS